MFNRPSLGRGVEGGNAGPLRCGKGTTYEGGVRVPAIAHMPNKVKPGRDHGLMASIDIVPTIMSWLNLDLDDDSINGKDQTRLIFGDGKVSHISIDHK